MSAGKIPQGIKKRARKVINEAINVDSGFEEYEIINALMEERRIHLEWRKKKRKQIKDLTVELDSPKSTSTLSYQPNEKSGWNKALIRVLEIMRTK